jgi:FkbM family methyltransferase
MMVFNKVIHTFKIVFHYVAPAVAHRQALSYHVHDEIECDLLPIFVDPGREAIDVGAHIGRYSARLSQIVPHVFAFEAHPRLAYVLKHSLPQTVTVKHAAVSHNSGLVQLNIPIIDGRQSDGLGSLESAADSVIHATVCKKIEVPAITLDELASHDIGFVKIDVEGHELNVLYGAQTLIERQRPTILVEAEERHNPGIIKKLFSFFSERQYVGIFFNGHKVCYAENFTPELQNEEIFKRMHNQGIPRKRIPYINNFLFVPAENWSVSLLDKITKNLSQLAKLPK